MKVLTVNTEFARGGAAQIAHTLHNALNKTTDYSSCFVFGRGPKVKDKGAFRFSWRPEVYLHAFLTRVTGLTGYGTWFSTQRLVRFILKEKFDLIHLHNLHGYYMDLSIALVP